MSPLATSCSWQLYHEGSTCQPQCVCRAVSRSFKVAIDVRDGCNWKRSKFLLALIDVMLVIWVPSQIKLRYWFYVKCSGKMGKISVIIDGFQLEIWPPCLPFPSFTTLPCFFACELVTLDRPFIWMRSVLRINFDSADQNIWMNPEEIHCPITWVFTVSLYVVKP